MSLKKVLLSGAALAVLSLSVPAFAMDEDHHGAVVATENNEEAYAEDHGAPEGHAAAEEDLSVPPIMHEMPEHEPEAKVEHASAPAAKAVPVAAVVTEEHAPAGHAAPVEHWSYDGAESAAHWGEMFKACAEGKMQSPINIAEFKQENLPKLKIAYAEGPLKVENNGHTVMVNYEPGSKFMSAEQIYDLKQIHFHTPSEHYVDGAPYPMEMHLVHTTPDGEIAVVAVMIKVGLFNPSIQKIWDVIPAAGMQAVPEGVTFNANEVLPKNGTYYTYTGSLTTPPCTEGVSWHVLQQPIEISIDQLNAFQGLYPNNARPIQQMHGRVVKGS